MSASCPVCDAAIEIKSAEHEMGELIDCPECGSQLEVTSVTPPTVAEAPEEEEDWGE